MYEAVIFDLDGTLVQTEKLKAISYARAAVELCPRSITEDQVIEAFKEVVGRSRQEVALFLIERFDLGSKATARMREFGVGTPWQAFAQVRLGIYEDMLADPRVLVSHQWPHNVELLREVRKSRGRTGLATMSHREQVQRVLEVLELENEFDFVATRDDVENPKPHPEIYLLVARELEVPPGECLVIEDSPAGVEAAKSAGMGVIAVTTPFTRQAFREGDLLDRRFIVDEPSKLPQTVRECVQAHRGPERSSQERSPT
jgi:HAD superfamily hydrolase (TIGR01509 family)